VVPSLALPLVPAKAASGNILVNTKTAPSSVARVKPGGSINLYFGLVTWEGELTAFYISQNAYPYLTLDDIHYGPTFSVAKIRSSTIDTTTYSGYNVGNNWINGTVPAFEIPGGNYYIKAFDGHTSSAVVVTDNYIKVLATFEVEPTSGPSRSPIELRGYALPANGYANLSWGRGSYPSATYTKIVDFLQADARGQFTYAMLVPDLSEAFDEQNEFYIINFRMIVIGTGQDPVYVSFNVQVDKGEATHTYYVRSEFLIWNRFVSDTFEVGKQDFELWYVVPRPQSFTDTIFIEDALLPSLEFCDVQFYPKNTGTYNYDTNTGKINITIDFSAIPSSEDCISISFWMKDVPGYEMPRLLEETPSFSRSINQLSGDEYQLRLQVSPFNIIPYDEFIITQIFVGLEKDSHIVTLNDYTREGAPRPRENGYYEVGWGYSSPSFSIPTTEALYSVIKGDVMLQGYNIIWLIYEGNPLTRGNLTVHSEATFEVRHRHSFGYHNHWKIALGNLPPTCVIKLQKDGVEISEVYVGEFFYIYVGDSTDDAGIKQVRFSSDDFQDGYPTGEWTDWYDWDTSSEDWNAETKTKKWSFATEGNKEVWAEVKDDTGQTAQGHAVVLVPYPALPVLITQDDVDFSALDKLFTSFAKVTAVSDPVPLFVQGSVNGYDQKVNVVLMISKPLIEAYRLVRIKTPQVEDSRYLELIVVFECDPTACLRTTFQRFFTDEFTAWRDEFGKKLFYEVVKKGAALIIDADLTPVSFLFSYVDCVERGMAVTLKGWTPGEEYLVYLPVGFNLAVEPRRDFTDAPQVYMTSPVFLQDLPGQVQGEWKGIISDDAGSIYVPIKETKNFWANFFGLFSPGELRIYDSYGRVTGLVNGQTREDIPHSRYYENNSAVAIFFPTHSYTAEVKGIATGTYRLEIVSVANGEASTVNATAIPTSLGAVHQYTIDWDALSQNEKGVAVKVDSDGDGTFEKKFAAGSDLTGDEFMLKVRPAEGFPIWIVGAAVGAIAVVTIAFFWRRRTLNKGMDRVTNY